MSEPISKPGKEPPQRQPANAPETTGATRKSRRLVIGAFVLAAIALLGWRQLWRVGAETMRTETDRFIAAQAAIGYDAAYERFSTSGFPFYLRGALHEARITQGSMQGATEDATRGNGQPSRPGATLVYETPRIHIDALPYALDRLIFSAPEPQRLTLGGEKFELRARRGRASIEADKERGWRLKISAPEAFLKVDGQTPEQSSEMAPETTLETSTGRIVVNAAPNTAADEEKNPNEDVARTEKQSGQLIDIGATVEDISVATAEGRQDIDRIEASLIAGETSLTLRGLAIAIGEARLTATGSLKVDEAGYLAGRIRTRLSKPAAFAEIITASGLLDPDEAAALTGALALAALAGGGEVRAPLVLENGEISTLGVRLGDAPRLREPS